jgi:hypothetical protein
MHTTSVTGIPIEVLFGIIGGLGMLVYADMRRIMNKLTRESEKRGRQMSVFRVYLSQLCAKSGVHFDERDNGN